MKKHWVHVFSWREEWLELCHSVFSIWCVQLHMHTPAHAGLKITVRHWKMFSQNQNLSDQTKNTLDILPDGTKTKLKTKINVKINWRYPTKHLYRKHLYQKNLQEYNSKSHVFTSSSVNIECKKKRKNKTKKHWIQNNLVFPYVSNFWFD